MCVWIHELAPLCGMQRTRRHLIGSARDVRMEPTVRCRGSGGEATCGKGGEGEGGEGHGSDEGSALHAKTPKTQETLREQRYRWAPVQLQRREALAAVSTTAAAA